MSYVARLREHRLNIPLSQAKFAAKAGVDRETIARCEQGYMVQDVSCAYIKKALIGLGIAAKDIEIVPGGQSGPIRRSESKSLKPKRKPQR